MAKKGGPRPNSGRRKGSFSKETLLQLEMRKQLTERVHKEFSGLIEAQIDLAKGLFVEEVVEVEDKENGKVIGKKQKRRVYKRPPSQEAMKYLIDQSLGKARETIDLNQTVVNSVTLDEIERGEQELLDAELNDQQNG